MPTVSVPKSYFLSCLRRDYTDDEVSEICADFGIELDEIVEEPERNSTTPVTTYKIDVGANRGDLLCAENLAKALRCFLALEFYKPIKIASSGIKVIVDKSVASVRPFILCAVVRGVKLQQQQFNSFIDHEDKLHENTCRRRQFAAIGTHDLEKIDPSEIIYKAEKPEDIKFGALKQTEIMDGRELFSTLKNDKLGEYLHLIESKPIWPVIRDGRNEVLSLPPIINSEYSKNTFSTSDIFIDCTATDLERGKMAINALISELTELATIQAVETVEIQYEQIVSPLAAETFVSPDLADEKIDVDVDKILKIAGVPISIEHCAEYLRKMQISATLSDDKKTVHCVVPFEREDVLSYADLIEDVLIGFGYSNISQMSHNCSCATIGRTLPSYKEQEAVRQELCCCGCIETMNFSLCPAEDSKFGELLVELGNTKTSSFTNCRSLLLPGMLRAAVCNESRPLPLKIFEVSEVMQRGGDIGVEAVGHCGCLFGGLTDMLSELHGVLDRVGVRIGKEFSIEESDKEFLLPGRRADVYCAGKRVGFLGVISLDILKDMKIPFPISAFEIDLSSLDFATK